MDVCVSSAELRKALAVIEKAEASGFNHCLAIFSLVSAGKCIDECLMEYDELIVRAHPTDPSLNWGRSFMFDSHDFVDGKLIRKGNYEE